MVIVGWLVVALAVWLLDSAIRNRPPIQTLKEIVTTGELPVTGKSYPAPSHLTPAASSDSSGGAATASYVQAGSGAATSDQVNQWISQAFTILAQNGVPASQLDTASAQIIIQNESGGDPTIVNTYDINAQEGHPSIGIMQTIQPTFDAYALPGHTNIDNPVDNIIAATRYAIANYGSLANVPGVIAVRAGGEYTGY